MLAGGGASIMKKAIKHVPPFNDKKELNVIIETIKGSRNKYKFDEDMGLFRTTKVLPYGMTFPYDFGFVPGTKCADGDPLDALVMMDQPAFAGCVVNCRIIGVIRGQQSDGGGKPEENDRIVAVEKDCREFSQIKDIGDLDKKLLEELEDFFVHYNELEGRKFKLLGCKGPNKATELIEESAAAVATHS
jgi:inorganic pyrophosphatase